MSQDALTQMYPFRHRRLSQEQSPEMSQPNDDPLPTPSLDGLDNSGDTPSNPLGIPEEALQGLLSRFGPGISELLQAGSQRSSTFKDILALLPFPRAPSLTPSKNAMNGFRTYWGRFSPLVMKSVNCRV